MSFLDFISSGLTAGTQGAAGYLQGQAKGRKEEDERARQVIADLRQKRIDEQNALMAQAQIGNLEDRLKPKPAEPFTLGQGQKRFGSDGKVIAEGAPEDPRNPIIGSPEWRAAERFKAGLVPRDDKTLVAVVGPDGKSPVLVPRSQAAGMVPWEKASGGGGRLGTGNVEQSKSLGFARRMIAADRILRAKEKTGKPTVPVQAAKTVPMIGDAASNLMSSTNQQAYDQAFQEWGSAQMRKESGAQINKEEWKQADKRYRRILFDKNATVKQKQDARLLATKMMVKAAGPGWTQEDQAELDVYLDEVEGKAQRSAASGPVDGGSVGRTISRSDYNALVLANGKTAADKLLKASNARIAP